MDKKILTYEQADDTSYAPLKDDEILTGGKMKM